MESHRVCLVTTYGETGTGGLNASDSNYIRPMLFIKHKDNKSIKKLANTNNTEISKVNVERFDGENKTLLKYESALVLKTIDKIVSWNGSKFNGTKEYEIHTNGKVYYYDSETGLIGNDKTAYIEGKQKEYFDRIIDRGFRDPNFVPPTTVLLPSISS